MVGSGPYMVTEFNRGRIVKMERNPNFRGEKPEFDEIQFIKYGTTDAVSARCGWARSTPRWRLEPTGFAQLEQGRRTSRRSAAPSPSFTAARLQPLLEGELPRREVQPGRAGPRRSGRRSRTRSTATASTRSPAAARRSPATACCPPTTRRWYETAERGLPVRPGQGQPDAGRRRLHARGRRRAQEGRSELSFDLFVRSESPLGHPGGQAGRRAGARGRRSSSRCRWSAWTS